MSKVYFMDQQECTICGELYPVRFMEKLFVGGSRTQYVCIDCYNNGLRKVDDNLFQRRAILEKMKQNK